MSLAVLLFSAPTEYASAQMVTLRYGQIPSKIKTVSALHFYIAQRKALCAPGETATPIHSLIVKPEIKSIADLKDKTVGSPSPPIP